MKPGIWVHRIHRPTDPHVKDIAEANPDWFVRQADGSLVQHGGVYMLNTTNQDAVENMIRKLYRGLHEQGWDGKSINEEICDDQAGKTIASSWAGRCGCMPTACLGRMGGIRRAHGAVPFKERQRQ
jgi:hypothetical protein